MISDFGLPGTLSGRVAFICLTKYSNQSQIGSQIGFPKTQIFSFTHLSWLQTFQGNQKQTKCIWWKVRIKWQEMNDWYPSTNLQVLKSIANMVVPFKNIISIACTKHALKTDEKPWGRSGIKPGEWEGTSCSCKCGKQVAHAHHYLKKFQAFQLKQCQILLMAPFELLYLNLIYCNLHVWSGIWALPCKYWYQEPFLQTGILSKTGKSTTILLFMLMNF